MSCWLQAEQPGGVFGRILVIGEAVLAAGLRGHLVLNNTVKEFEHM